MQKKKIEMRDATKMLILDKNKSFNLRIKRILSQIMQKHKI